MSFSELQQIEEPTTLAQEMFNLPTGSKNNRILTIEELAQKRIPGQWNVSVVDLVAILDDLPTGYEMVIACNNEEI